MPLKLSVGANVRVAASVDESGTAVLTATGAPPASGVYVRTPCAAVGNVVTVTASVA